MDNNICLKCKHSEKRKAASGLSYIACVCKPYDGACVKYIKCPLMKFISVNEAFPEYVENCASVYMKCSNGKIKKGMFYYNGGKPVFASFGSQINNVTEWAYR